MLTSASLVLTLSSCTGTKEWLSSPAYGDPPPLDGVEAIGPMPVETKGDVIVDFLAGGLSLLPG